MEHQAVDPTGCNLGVRVCSSGPIKPGGTERSKCANIYKIQLFLVRLSYGSVFRKAVSANQGTKVKLGFDFSCIKAYIRANICEVLS